VSLLADRLSDEDDRVVRVAYRSLFCFRQHPGFQDIVHELRQDLQSDSATLRAAAMAGLSGLGDSGSVPLLIKWVSTPGSTDGQLARRALVQLTKVDLGDDPGSWSLWWAQNRDRHRVQWLIDGLVQERLDLRHHSAFELNEATGMDFGYLPDMDPKARQEVREQYHRWWVDSGSLNFVRFG
jgi:hypothetical protein